MVAGLDHGELTVGITVDGAQEPSGDDAAQVGPVIVTRLLLTPIIHPAPAGAGADVVRVSGGGATIYLLPVDYEAADQATLSALLAAKTNHPS